jgi:hypothetical protein
MRDLCSRKAMRGYMRTGTLDDSEIVKPQMTIWTSSAPRPRSTRTFSGMGTVAATAVKCASEAQHFNVATSL